MRECGASIGPDGEPAADPGPRFAVLDVETTGLAPAAGDRVLEIAVLCLNRRGETLQAFETLVRPDGPVGATAIHGITEEDLRHAPRFGEVVGAVLPLLDGAVWVAHNAAFDVGFLDAECARVGLPVGNPLRVCTVRTARRRCAGLPRRNLASVCRHFGIVLEDAHSAMADCRATAEILRRFLCETPVEGLDDLKAFAVEGRGLFAAPLCAPATGSPLTRDMARGGTTQGVRPEREPLLFDLDELSSAIPRSPRPPTWPG